MYKVLIAVFLLVSAQAYGGGWTVTDAKIESMKYESNILVVHITGGIFKLHDGCETQNYVILEDETVRGDRQLSMLLAAQMAGKEVSIYTSGCATKWNLDYPKVWAVKVDS